MGTRGTRERTGSRVGAVGRLGQGGPEEWGPEAPGVDRGAPRHRAFDDGRPGRVKGRDRRRPRRPRRVRVSPEVRPPRPGDDGGPPMHLPLTPGNHHPLDAEVDPRPRRGQWSENEEKTSKPTRRPTPFVRDPVSRVFNSLKTAVIDHSLSRPYVWV